MKNVEKPSKEKATQNYFSAVKKEIIIKKIIHSICEMTKIFCQKRLVKNNKSNIIIKIKIDLLKTPSIFIDHKWTSKMGLADDS